MEAREISFVTWPDGKVDDKSLTVSGQRIAQERMISQWLPANLFGNIAGYHIDGLWRGMSEKGFRSYTIKIGKDGEPELTT